MNRILPALVVASLLAGCRDPERAQGGAAALCSQLSDASAARLAECYGATAAYVDRYSRSLDATVCAGVAGAEAAGSLRYEAAGADACVAAIRSHRCDDFEWDDLDLTRCAAALVGTLPPGSACRSDLDCADGTCVRNGGCAGTCAAYVDAGESCALGPCRPGLFCSGGTPPTCAVYSPPSQGGTCGSFSPQCSGGLYCSWNSWTCIAQRALGETCERNVECQQGLACAPIGTCQPWATVGASCTSLSVVCPLGSTCAGGRCTAWPAVGASCAGFAQCIDGWCDGATSTCAAWKPEGAACTSYVQCAPGLDCNGSTCVGTSCY